MNRHSARKFAMADEFEDVTDAELAVLQVLWDHGVLDVRGIVSQLYPAATNSDIGTVQKLLERLETKGCIRRDRSARRHHFEPVVKRPDLIGRRVRELAEKMCGGSVAPLLTHFAQAEGLTADEIAELRRFLDGLVEQQRKRKRTNSVRKKRTRDQ